MVETQVKTKQWGSSIGVIIPKEVVDEMGIKPNEVIVVGIKKRPKAKEVFWPSEWMEEKHTRAQRRSEKGLGVMDYYFDTYALIELTKNNLSYVPYLEKFVTTTIHNLVELYFIILRDFGEEKAKLLYHHFKASVVPVPDEVIFLAMKIKMKNRKLSYTDCIGYAFAMKHNMKFLTGDKEFEKMDNVEFVRK